MDIGKILIISFSCFMSSILFCICVKYCKEKVRETREIINFKKKNNNRLKRQTIIKPITDVEEKVKDKKDDDEENNLRIGELIHDEDNV